MERFFIYSVLIVFIANSFGQVTKFNDLDEALKNPEIVKSLRLYNHQIKYSKELPSRLIECKNINNIYIGNQKNFDFPKLFKLLSQLPKLDTLEMYACDIKEIPKEISLLTNLKYLNLSSNKLISLPENIDALSNLTQLILTNNKIVELPNSICGMQKLEELNLTSNNLISLPNDIYKLKSLKKLAIYGNELQALPKKIGQLTLEEIYLGGYKNQFALFPYEIFQINTLKHLGIYDIKIDSFPIAITNLKNLRSIGLRKLKDFNWIDAFLKLSNLSTINKADLGFEHNVEIPKEISTLKTLQELELTGSIKSYKTLQYVSELTNLTKLKFEYYIDTLLPPQIEQLINLKYLEIGSSKLYSLPAEIGSLINLEKLVLSTNYGQNITIPKEIGKLKNLKEIDFGRCDIKHLPPEIGNLNNLVKLDLWGGDLDSLPITIGQLQKLEILYLAQNKLQKLPFEFFNLKSLKVINLSDNKLQSLDNNFCKLTNLENLDLSGNVGLKTIPECLGTLKMISDLDLSNTQIKQLPNSLINHSKIKSIKLCKTLIQNTKEIDNQYKDKIEWEWNCRNLERLLINFSEKYGSETNKLTSTKDSIILNYSYSYNEPNVIDEEYSEHITIKFSKSVLESNKIVSIPDSNFTIAATFFSVWDFGSDYKNLKGKIQIIEKEKNKIKLSISLSGKLYNEESNILSNKTLEFKR